ncbi:hypothetical protein QA612_20660 [Evansella sp. AB-P1]|uniref:hypothetical protein n=1 Tax=Evansella sp. AB-P1 TaxID=3037653 RepID=UPI00241D700B|nr:hypothetical protein [Evansella sp. AB-P1]MDG5789872.1 hypothetical protein [Evansella sp. AB-P1]
MGGVPLFLCISGGCIFSFLLNACGTENKEGQGDSNNENENETEDELNNDETTNEVNSDQSNEEEKEDEVVANNYEYLILQVRSP